MTSASTSSARSLFAESKQRLAERVQVNINNILSLSRQIHRGSKSSEMLMKSARETASIENNLQNAEGNCKKMLLIAEHMGYQFDNIHKSAQLIPDINEQLTTIQR